MEPEASLPLPVPTGDNQGFWDACKRHQLVVQRCRGCGTLRHPPRPTCPRCRSTDFEWHPLSGRGTIYTYTITHQPVHPSLKGRTPWIVVMVEMEEGVRMVSHLVDCPPDQVRIDVPVEVVFEKVNDQVTLPYFRPAASPG